MKTKIILFSIVPISIILGMILGIFNYISDKEIDKLEVTSDLPNDNIISGDVSSTDSGEINLKEDDNTAKENSSISHITPFVYDSIKAVYATGWVAGTKNLREEMITKINDTGFNAVVLDIKDESGHLSYNSNVETAINIKSSRNMIKDINSVISEFHDNGIYVIGRIVTFKDPTYAKTVKDISYKKADGTYWVDKSGNYWPNPYNENSWEYPIALAKEAAGLGFDEIQFDYIRFPSSEGRVKDIAYGFESNTISKSQIINKFLTKVMDEMADYKVKISADVFGIITKRDGDFEKIGQDYKEISKIVDIVCPMVYPSHYGYGEYKVSKPDLNPYAIIYGSISDAQKRVARNFWRYKSC